ncbi:hypothetical protein D3272_04925 [Lichenibacterium ramalinae]|uniref:Uncharacterized protein n=1 Tax=Lichenibacterium ramalinae TaxID=2316527 RepID=A0A4Q2RF67_9HYPH|nr:hypothetical protein D3272_04925 [Lichenibacterium ramalinae]
MPDGGPVRSGPHQFDAVAEWVVDTEALVAGEGLVVDRSAAAVRQSGHQEREMGHEGRMRRSRNGDGRPTIPPEQRRVARRRRTMR